MFLNKKCDKPIKVKMVYNGKQNQEWLSREYLESPTAVLESIMLTAIVDANEEQNVMSVDVPNTLIQNKMPDIKYGEEREIMKITGVLVDLPVKMAP